MGSNFSKKGCALFGICVPQQELSLADLLLQADSRLQLLT
jgi:hypothetical protein